MSTVKVEDHSPLGDFIVTSIAEHLGDITARFPKRNKTSLDELVAALDRVKSLESTYVKTEELKSATAKLASGAYALNRELNFMKDYLKEAGLDFKATSRLKRMLTTGNIEGATLLLKDLADYAEKFKHELMDEGMPADFPAELRAWRVTLSADNAMQNKLLNDRKDLYDTNRQAYDTLYDLIMKFANAGKKVFAGTVTADEFTVSKVLKRMHHERRAKDEMEAGV